LKATGIVRRIDDLGRVVLPKEMRISLDMNPGDPVEIAVENKNIIISKPVDGCAICGGLTEPYVEFGGKKICAKCKSMLKAALI
jgi:transcriptional pleiotropic regulator of transition state genes